MQKDEELLEKRFEELARMAYQKGIPLFSDFLSINELHILHTRYAKTTGVITDTFGGYEMAERQMAVFYPDALSVTISYPFSVLKICPKHPKYAENLTHRDYLGAIVNLGIDRSKIGDILVKEQSAYVICHNKIKDFLIQECCRIRHTEVQVEECSLSEEDVTPEFESITGTVASIRLDSVLSVACNRSRSSVLSLIQGEKVFVNGCIKNSASFVPKAGDYISVRGVGKFILQETPGTTKKKRFIIELLKYK